MLDAPQIEPRGVYWARHRKRGMPVLYAVDSRGEVVKRLLLLPTTNVDDAIDYLCRLLEHVDPPRTLGLIKPNTEREEIVNVDELIRRQRRYLAKTAALRSQGRLSWR